MGLFKLALKLTENDYRILCYHGIAIKDEHLFWPGIFITQELFKKHLQIIRKYQFNVLPLNDLVNKQHQCKRALVLTFDDGFYSTKLIEPLLKNNNYPATLYVTTYYVKHQRIIFNIALRYLFYKSLKTSINLTLLDDKKIWINKNNGFEQSLEELINYGNQLTESEQNELLERLSRQLEVDIESLVNQRIFYNLNAEELKELHQNEVFDIQLHTHRHNLSDDKNSQFYEIQTNRAAICEITGKKEQELIHFCYPSGIWKKQYIPWLSELGIQSAVTVDFGLNKIGYDFLALKRIHCSNDKPLIIFEAEISGFNSLVKKWINKNPVILNSR